MGRKIIESTGMAPGILLHIDRIDFRSAKVINSETASQGPLLKSHLKTLKANWVKSGI